MANSKKLAPWRRAAAVLLAAVLLIGPFPGGDARATSAAPPAPAASAGNALQSDETQSAQVRALGLPDEQPPRISPSGKELDKSQNPLGPNRLAVNRIYQLALIGDVFSSGQLKLFDDFIDAGMNLAQRVPAASPAWTDERKTLVAADADGDGKQEVVTAALVPGQRNRVDLKVFVTDYSEIKKERRGYSEPTVSNIFPIAFNLPKPEETDPGSPLLAVAGDFDRDGRDEIALAFADRLYVCRVDMQRREALSVRQFDDAIASLSAVDANGDGYLELLVTTEGVHTFSTVRPAVLHVYAGTDLNSPDATIALQNSISRDLFTSASVTVGDIFGEGSPAIVVGGISTRGPGLSYLRYHPETESYDSGLGDVHRLEATWAAVKSRLTIDCANLDTPIPGTPELVTMGGFLFKYDQTTGAFAKVDVTQFTNNSPTVKGNNPEACEGNITNINVDKNSTHILSTAVGNFDGNKSGREQIVMLHYNQWYGGEYVYLTSCSLEDDGKIGAQLREICRPDEVPYRYPSICAADVFNRGVSLEFQPERSKFMFSNPTVVAVLGAPPYYSELADQYGAMGNDGTTYGTETSSSAAGSKGVTAEVGVSFGFSQGFSILGVEMLRVSFETQVNNSFAWEWTKAKSISRSMSFTNMNSDDAVVVMVIPYDTYYYRACYADETGEVQEEEMVMQVPYDPITMIMPLTDYNQAAAAIPNAPLVGPEVLQHAAGNPRSYPRSAQGLSNIEGEDVLQGDSFIGGTGNSITSQSITTASTAEKAFSYALDVNVSFNVSVFGASTGASVGAGYTSRATVSTSESTLRAGSVASVPSAHPEYGFQWNLAAYNYQLSAGDATQKCTVISYLVKPIGSFPPAVPAELSVGDRTLTANALKWSPSEGAAGYEVFRATAADGSFLDISGPIAGQQNTSFTDNNISPNQTYYYRVLAYAGKASVPSAPLEVQNLSVNRLVVRSQPRLTYDEGEALDLSGLVVRLRASNGSVLDVPYANFAQNHLTASLADGVSLQPGQTGVPITVKYAPQDLWINTDNLTVNASSPYDLTMSAEFTVGRASPATALAPNKLLQAVVQLHNKLSTSQRVIVILALYDEQGTMVQVACEPAVLAGGARATVTPTLQLPDKVKDYSARVFVWDGTDLASTTLTPKAETAEIPAH